MNDLVDDNEIVYRRVIFDPQCFVLEESKKLIVTASAFRDRNHQPSVDRAILCDNDPHHTQGVDKRNGVVLLIASEIRAIADVIKYDGDRPAVVYEIDVVPAPLIDNVAHAEVRAHPTISSSKVFRRLQQGLAMLANKRGWLIYPEGFRE
jgi:hypothetical protein